MESHESAGIPEEEYVRLRRRTMVSAGIFAGGVWMRLGLHDAYENYIAGKGFEVELLLALVLGPLVGWLVGYCSWGVRKDKALKEYKAHRELAAERRAVGKWEARIGPIMCALGIMAMGLDLWLLKRPLQEYAAPAAIIGTITAIVAVVRGMRREAYYEWMTGGASGCLTLEQQVLLFEWLWAVLLLTFPFAMMPVLSLLLFFFILFYPLDRALVLRSRREFGGGAGDAAEA